MAATVNKRWITVQGPVKEEKIWITSDGTASDTAISSLLANPQTVDIAPVNVDLSNTASAASVTKSGKVLTLKNAVAARDYVIRVLGF